MPSKLVLVGLTLFNLIGGGLLVGYGYLKGDMLTLGVGVFAFTAGIFTLVMGLLGIGE